MEKLKEIAMLDPAVKKTEHKHLYARQQPKDYAKKKKARRRQQKSSRKKHHR